VFNTSYDVVLHKVVPLGVRKFKFKILTELLILKSENFTMVPMGNLKKNLNCHNSGCTQDSVVIFDSRVGFSGRPI